MSPSITTVIILTFHLIGCWAQSDQPELTYIDAAKYPMNRWKIMGMTFKKSMISNSTRLGASFTLYRSYYEPCPKTEFEEGMRMFPCGWLIPDHPIACSSESTIGKGDWHTCVRYPEAVEGEESVPLERQKWLRWRIEDLKEGANATFQSVRIVFANGLPGDKK
jgi:hypothetical protein